MPSRALSESIRLPRRQTHPLLRHIDAKPHPSAPDVRQHVGGKGGQVAPPAVIRTSLMSVSVVSRHCGLLPCRVRHPVYSVFLYMETRDRRPTSIPPECQLSLWANSSKRSVRHRDRQLSRRQGGADISR